jgi:hypothetical protein
MFEYPDGGLKGGVWWFRSHEATLPAAGAKGSLREEEEEEGEP